MALFIPGSKSAYKVSVLFLFDAVVESVILSEMVLALKALNNIMLIWQDEYADVELNLRHIFPEPLDDFAKKEA